MQGNRIKRASLGIAVYEALKQDILTNRIAPGSAMKEEELLRRFAISRTPIREALQALEGEGLLHRSAFGTARVPPLSRADAIHLYHTRAVLEGLVARQVAGCIDDDTLAQCQRAVDRIRVASVLGDPISVAEYGETFHSHLAELSGNLYSIRSLTVLRSHVSRYRHFSMQHSDQRLSTAAQEHQQILDAICQGNADKAEQLMYTHILAGLGSIQEALARTEQVT